MVQVVHIATPAVVQDVHRDTIYQVVIVLLVLMDVQVVLQALIVHLVHRVY